MNKILLILYSQIIYHLNFLRFAKSCSNKSSSLETLLYIEFLISLYFFSTNWDPTLNFFRKILLEASPCKISSISNKSCILTLFVLVFLTPWRFVSLIRRPPPTFHLEPQVSEFTETVLIPTHFEKSKIFSLVTSHKESLQKTCITFMLK